MNGTIKVILTLILLQNPVQPAFDRPASPGVAALVVTLTTIPTAEEKSTFAKYDGMSYLADKLTPVRSKPEATGKIVWTMKPLELAYLAGVETGWLKIASGDKRGWIQAASIDEVVLRSADQAADVIGDLDDKPWPLATKIAIIRKTPKIGFSMEQVLATLGDPISRTDEETSAGKTTVVAYRDRVLTQTGGKVTKITTVK